MARVSLFLISILSLLALDSRADSPSTPPQTPASMSADARAILSAYRGIAEEHIGGVLRTLRVMAQTDEMRSAKPDQLQPLLARCAEDLSTEAAVWFVFPDGHYFSTASNGIAKEVLQDRPYFPALMTGKEIVGDLVISKSTGHRSVVLAVPVVQNGKVIGGVGVSLRVRLLSELIATHVPLPPSMYFYALQRDTRIVLHQKAERMFKTPSDIGDEALGDLFARTLHGDSGSLNYLLHGKNITAIFQRSPKLDWYFFLAQELSTTLR